MTFSISIFLYVYWAFLAFWFIFFMVAIYHIMKFGAKNFITLATTSIFIGIAVLILITSSYYINQIDWENYVNLFQGFFNNEMIFE